MLLTFDYFIQFIVFCLLGSFTLKIKCVTTLKMVVLQEHNNRFNGSANKRSNNIHKCKRQCINKKHQIVIENVKYLDLLHLQSVIIRCINQLVHFIC